LSEEGKEKSEGEGDK